MMIFQMIIDNFITFRVGHGSLVSPMRSVVRTLLSFWREVIVTFVQVKSKIRQAP